MFSNSQCGFRKNYRTTDHVFTHFSMIKNTSKVEIIFTPIFVDFQKACDSILSDDLKFNLQNSEIKGKFFQRVDSMYASTKFSKVIMIKFLNTLRRQLAQNKMIL